MKIERISENSIRCTLTGFDLSVRNLNLKELAYGTEKARKLFQEMMMKASSEVGFEAENTPIMIEAIPLNGDSIQLVITKVEDPEELDTRFSKFSPMPKSGSEDWIRRLTSELLEGTDGLLRQMQQLSGTAGAGKPQPFTPAAGGQTNAAAPQAQPAEPVLEIPYRIYAFDSLDRVIEASRSAAGFRGANTLYKRSDGQYILLIENRDTDTDDFSKTCNVIAEYGRKVKEAIGSLAYFEEHYERIVKDHAVQKLGRL